MRIIWINRKKILYIIGIFVLLYILYTLYSFIKINLNETVKISLEKYVNLNVKFDDLNVGILGKVTIKNFVLKDKRDEDILLAKKITLYYDYQNIKRLKKILIEEADINFVMYKDYNINFIEVFKKENQEIENKKIIPIDKIVLKNSSLNYIDYNYEDPIQRRLDKVSGEIKFNKNYDVLIDVYGERQNERYKVRITKNLLNEDKPYIKLKLNDIKLDSNILQYAYLEYIEIEEGVADLDLELDPDLYLYGKGSFRSGVVSYNEFDKKIKYIRGEAKFNKDKIKIQTEGIIEGEKINFSLDLNFKELIGKMEVTTENVAMKLLNSYLKLGEYNLNFDGIINNIKLESYILGKNNLKFKLETFAKKVKINEEYFQDVKLNLSFDNKSKDVNLDEVIFNHKKTLNEDLYFDGDYKFKGKTDFESIDGNFEVKNIKGNLELKKINGNLRYNFLNEILEINLTNNEIDKLKSKINFKNGEIDFVLKIKKQLGINFRDEKFNVDFDLVGNMNYIFKEINYMDGSISVFNYKDIKKIRTDINVVKNQLNFSNLKMNKEKSFSNLKGEIDLKKLTYAIEILETKVFVEEFLNNKKISGYISGKGFLFGEKNFYQADIEIEDGVIEDIAEFNQIKGKLRIYKDINIGASGNINIGEVKYLKNKMEALYLNFELLNDKFQLNDLSNNFLKIRGNYNVQSNNMDFKYKIKDYRLKDFSYKNSSKMDIAINSLNGTVKGKLEDPIIDCELDDIRIDINKLKEISVNGKILYEKKLINLNNFRIDENVVNGRVDIKNSNLDIKINLLEKNLEKFYNISTIKSRVIGEINLWGDFENFKSVGELYIDNAYFKNRKMPQLLVNFTFNNGNIFDPINNGLFNFSKILVFNQKNQELLESSGNFNLKTKEIIYRINNQKINLDKIDYYTESEKIVGILNIDYTLKGKPNDFKYNLDINSEEIKYGNIKVENVKNQLSGDASHINLKSLEMSYNDNPFKAVGTIKLNPLKYDFKIKSENIDLKLLNIFFKGKLKDFSGSARVNVELNEKETFGMLDIYNLGAKLDDESLIFSNLNTQVILDGNNIKIEKLNGKINNGIFDISGFFKFSGINLDKIEYKKPDIEDWDFKIKFRDFDYRYKKMMNCLLDGYFDIKKDKIEAILTLKQGEVRGIPKFMTNNKAINNDNKESKLGISDNMKIILDINIANKVKVALENFSVIQDIEAEVEGGGRLTVENKRAVFLGSFSTKKGVITINNNYFKIDSGVVVFDDPFKYLPDINPSVRISANTSVVNKNIIVNLDGYYNELRFYMTSDDKDLSNDQILSLLAFHKDLNEKGENSNAGKENILVKDILDRQLSDQIFNPLSRRLQKILKFQKVKLSTSIFKLEGKENNSDIITDEESTTDPSIDLVLNENILLGATFELRNKLYQDFLFWNLDGKMSDKQQGKFKNIDFWVDYKFSEKVSWSLGMESVNDDIIDEIEKDVNVHINLEYNIEKTDYEIDFKYWNEKKDLEVELKYKKKINIF